MPLKGDNMMGVKRNNRSAVLRILQRQGSTSRKRLSEITRLTPAAITKIVGEMLSEGLLTEGDAVSSGSAGRREILLQLKPDARCALGVLINLRQAILSAVRLDGTVIFSEEIALPPRADADEWVPRLAGRLMELVAQHGLPRDRLIGLGIAVRGISSPDERSVSDSFGALRQQNVALCSRFEALTGLPAVLANNVRALFAAQLFLSREEDKGSQFFLRCEYGIGASLSIRDRIWNGASQQCSEIGHIPLVRRGGKLCSCGKTGCLETVASPGAILEDSLAILSPETTPVLWKLSEAKPRLEIADVLEAARNGDQGVAAVVDRAVSALAGALKSVIYLLDPERIVLYGQLFSDSYYLARLQAEMREGVDLRHSVSVEKSRFNLSLENKAAGLLMVQRFFENGGMSDSP